MKGISDCRCWKKETQDAGKKIGAGTCRSGISFSCPNFPASRLGPHKPTGRQGLEFLTRAKELSRIFGGVICGRWLPLTNPRFGEKLEARIEGRDWGLLHPRHRRVARIADCYGVELFLRSRLSLTGEGCTMSIHREFLAGLAFALLATVLSVSVSADGPARREVPREHPRLLGSLAQLQALARSRPQAYARMAAVARRGAADAHSLMMSMALVAAIEGDPGLARRSQQLAMKYVAGRSARGMSRSAPTWRCARSPTTCVSPGGRNGTSSDSTSL
jgi:hypothetical protein